MIFNFSPLSVELFLRNESTVYTTTWDWIHPMTEASVSQPIIAQGVSQFGKSHRPEIVRCTHTNGAREEDLYIYRSLSRPVTLGK